MGNFLDATIKEANQYYDRDARELVDQLIH